MSVLTMWALYTLCLSGWADKDEFPIGFGGFQAADAEFLRGTIAAAPFAATGFHS